MLHFACRLQGSTERVHNFFETTVPLFSFHEFKMHFRMSPPCFEMLAKNLASMLEFMTSSMHGGRV